jgi:hypothetical protein
MFVQLSLLARALSSKCFESVAVGMKNAVHMRHTVASSVTRLAVWYYSKLSHDGTILEKKVQNKTGVLIFRTIFV